MAEPMLSVYNINVWYGAIHAIKDISFNVNEGEIVALIGANGAGKSTTLKTISGLLRSKTGSIKFMGEDITHTPADKLVGKGRPGSRGPSRLFADDGRGEPGDGRLHAAQVHGGLRALSASTSSSRALRSAVARSPAPFRAANSRCSLWGAPL